MPPPKLRRTIRLINSPPKGMMQRQTTNRIMIRIHQPPIIRTRHRTIRCTLIHIDIIHSHIIITLAHHARRLRTTIGHSKVTCTDITNNTAIRRSHSGNKHRHNPHKIQHFGTTPASLNDKRIIINFISIDIVVGQIHSVGAVSYDKYSEPKKEEAYDNGKLPRTGAGTHGLIAGGVEVFDWAAYVAVSVELFVGCIWHFWFWCIGWNVGIGVCGRLWRRWLVVEVVEMQLLWGLVGLCRRGKGGAWRTVRCVVPVGSAGCLGGGRGRSVGWVQQRIGRRDRGGVGTGASAHRRRAGRRRRWRQAHLAQGTRRR
mmetsp:Transcript_19354/g.28890  ORF Transcript_19354/g.28890 Transcript_19354/m.28890 type:complete len:314 (-) Transcript_19354:414-1355(-)